MSLSSCRQGLKLERNKLVRTSCVCIITVVSKIIVIIQQMKLLPMTDVLVMANLRMKEEKHAKQKSSF